LGGSIGIALLSAMLTWREHFHSHRLGESISFYDPQTRDRLEAWTQNLLSQGLDLVSAQDRAVGLLDLTVRKQAYLLAFNDCFLAVSVLLAVMAPLIFLCRQTKSADAAGAH